LCNQVEYAGRNASIPWLFMREPEQR